MLCPLQAMDVLKLLASVNVGGCHSEIKASLCTFPYPSWEPGIFKLPGNPRLPSFLSFVPSHTCLCLGVLTEWQRGGSRLPFAWALLKQLPPPTDLPSEAEDTLLLGKFASPVAAVWTASLPGWANDTGKETLRRKRKDDRKCNAPVFVKSQNESVRSLVPERSGINVKDSWLFSSACQYISTRRKH